MSSSSSTTTVLATGSSWVCPSPGRSTSAGKSLTDTDRSRWEHTCGSPESVCEPGNTVTTLTECNVFLYLDVFYCIYFFICLNVSFEIIDFLIHLLVNHSSGSGSGLFLLTVSFMSLSTADSIVPGGVLSVCYFPGGSSSLQWHCQLSDWHCHRAVRRSCLFPRCPSSRIQTTSYDHQAAAWVNHTRSITDVSDCIARFCLNNLLTCCCLSLQVLWLTTPSTPATVCWRRWTKVNSI